MLERPGRPPPRCARRSVPTPGTFPTDCPGWSVRDHLSHLIGTELGLLGHGRAGAARADARATSATRSARATRPGSRPGGACPATEVLAEFVAVTTRRLEELARLPARALDVRGMEPDRRGSLRRVHADPDHGQLGARPGHALGRRPARRPGRSRRAVALTRLTSGMGYVVGRQVGPPDGTTVVFDIEGPLPRTVAAVGWRAPGPRPSTIRPDAPTRPARPACGALRPARPAGGSRRRGGPRSRRGHFDGDEELGRANRRLDELHDLSRDRWSRSRSRRHR